MNFKWLLIVLLLLAALLIYYKDEIPSMREPTTGKELDELEQKPDPNAVREPSTERVPQQ
ncbi:MAG: hypothetical protein ACR2IE_02215 [Candidatus Sumerlaeaceae bacterium]